MSIHIRVELPDGRVWAVGGAIFSRADVIIPIDQIEGLSDAEIGGYVRSLIDRAEMAYAQTEADYVLYRAQIRNWDNTISPEAYEALFMRFEGRTHLIDQALRIIRDRIAQENAVIEKRRRTKQHRNDLSNDYNRLFVTIGQRGGFCCAKCKAITDLTIDHITALANGGTNDFDNLQILCRSCNSRKGAR